MATPAASSPAVPAEISISVSEADGAKKPVKHHRKHSSQSSSPTDTPSGDGSVSPSGTSTCATPRHDPATPGSARSTGKLSRRNGAKVRPVSIDEESLAYLGKAAADELHRRTPKASPKSPTSTSTSEDSAPATLSAPATPKTHRSAKSAHEHDSSAANVAAAAAAAAAPTRDVSRRKPRPATVAYGAASSTTTSATDDSGDGAAAEPVVSVVECADNSSGGSIGSVSGTSSSQLSKKKRFPGLGGPVVFLQQRPMACMFIEKQGYLLKKSPNTGRWKKRYVVVTPELLCCFKDATDAGEPEITVNLQFAVVRPRMSHDAKPGFDVVTTDCELSLMAPDARANQEWIAHIGQAIEHLVEESAAACGRDPAPGVGGTSSSSGTGTGGTGTGAPAGPGSDSSSDDEGGEGGHSSSSVAERTRAALQELLARPENRLCADCSRPDPQWASTNLGSFVCITCCGIHRGLGVHITKMRSVTMDTWTPELVAAMAAKGNAKVNAYYLATLPPDVHVPTPDTPVEELKQFICDKYVRCRYVPEEDKGRLPVRAAPCAPSSALIAQTSISSDDLFPHQKNRAGGSAGAERFVVSSSAAGRKALSLEQHLMFMSAICEDAVFRAELQRFIFAADNGATFKATLLAAVEKDEEFRNKLKQALLQ